VGEVARLNSQALGNLKEGVEILENQIHKSELALKSAYNDIGAKDAKATAAITKLRTYSVFRL